MKVRNGFISNSSSSSFIIGIKDEKSARAILNKACEVPEQHPFHDMIEEMVSAIVRSISHCDELGCDLTSYMEWVNEEGEDVDENIVNAINKGLTVYRGYFSDEGGDDIESLLCNTSFNIVRDDFVFIKEDGY